MKICFVAPGEIQIPPRGWGALETVLWNQYESLKKYGHEVFFLNDKSTSETLKQVKDLQPDVVHLHYGKHWEMMPEINCKKIVTSHDGSFLNSMNFHEHLVRNFYYDCTFFCLTSFEKDFLTNIGISKNKALILPNGVNCKKFNSVKKEFVKNKDLSICLGKIDERKRQSTLQKQVQNVAFVGQCHDPNFDDKSKNYLGPWTTEEVQENLTHYANLILLSSSELQPLVCLEAMSAGLGLVISEVSSQNLDVSKEFITVIPDEYMGDVKYIKNKIEQNRIVSLNSRDEITSYASEFDWLKIAEKWLQLNEKTK